MPDRVARARAAKLSWRPAMDTPDSHDRPSARARRSGQALGRARGALDLSTAVWLSLAGSIFYFGFMVVPPYVESYEVKQMLRTVGNLAIHQSDDGSLKREVINRARAIGSHYEIRDGQEMNLPGIVLLDDDVIVNRDTEAKTIVVQVHYVKHLNYPFTSKQTELGFDPAVKVDISEVKWP